MNINEIREEPAYREWLSKQSQADIDTDEIREVVRRDLSRGNELSQFNYTLWRKWQVLNETYSKDDDETQQYIKSVKDKIWIPSKPQDYLALEPEVIYVNQSFPIRRISIWGNERFMFRTNPDPLSKDWTTLGDFISTGNPTAGNVGRTLRFLVRDKKTKKYLGFLALSGDYLDLPGRDQFIGWSRDSRGNGKMIEHTAAGSAIVPTQPFGYNYLGGKLLSLLLTSEPVCEAWQDIYGKKLAGISTTSLYGGEKSSSQYDGLKPYWKNLGLTAGSSTLRPRPSVERELREWMRMKHPEKYWEFLVATRPTGLPLVRYPLEKVRVFCYQELGIPKSLYGSSHQRGTYFCALYGKTPEFLRGGLHEKDLGSKRFDNTTESLVERWKVKYAAKRSSNLVNQGRFSYQTEFYDELLSLSWDQTLEQFGQ